MRLPSRYHHQCKAIVDFLVAAVMLIVASPLILLAALLVKLTSRGPAFYLQTRLGQHGRLYTIYKLRTMTHDCERHSGPRWSTPGDTRVTLLGRFLRRSHIDELPQLLNVLRGDMSLVGPRPERPEFLPQLERNVCCYRARLIVRPGVTGLAQVLLPPDSGLDTVRRKLAHDLFYAQHAGMFFDLRIVLATGLHLIGVPYALVGMVFFLPRGATVDVEYERLVKAATASVDTRFPTTPVDVPGVEMAAC
jgi:lipopolysaccharide/colanic/teichoic acid biosynthesis glycosyltransferase